jgi:2-oxoglutarate ferredoxin oxidoreductase subunit beta
MSHKGLSVVDVISPCVTFNDHEGSTKSYSYVKEHETPLHELNYVPYYEEIQVEIADGETREVQLHDGSHLRLKKLDRDYDPTSKKQAIDALHDAEAKGEVLTGILYYEQNRETLLDMLNMVDDSLATLPLDRVRPPKAELDRVMEELR